MGNHQHALKNLGLIVFCGDTQACYYNFRRVEVNLGMLKAEDIVVNVTEASEKRIRRVHDWSDLVCRALRIPCTFDCSITLPHQGITLKIELATHAPTSTNQPEQRAASTNDKTLQQASTQLNEWRKAGDVSAAQWSAQHHALYCARKLLKRIVEQDLPRFQGIKDSDSFAIRHLTSCVHRREGFSAEGVRQASQRMYEDMMSRKKRVI